MGDAVLKFKETEETSSWREHLLVQQKITSYIDHRLIFVDQDWITSRKVLDIGCGYGDQTESLAGQNRNKEFLGVDIDEKAISYAKAHKHYNNVKYQIFDVNTDKKLDQFDCIVTKLVLQHLPSLENYLKFCSKNLVKDGVVFIIDTYDKLRRMKGLEEDLKAIYLQLESKQKFRGTHRHALKLLPDLAIKFGFSLEKESIVSGITGLEMDKKDLLRLYQINLSIIRNEYKVDFDLDRINEKLEKWLKDPKSYGTITCHCMKLRKV